MCLVGSYSGDVAARGLWGFTCPRMWRCKSSWWRHHTRDHARPAACLLGMLTSARSLCVCVLKGGVPDCSVHCPRGLSVCVACVVLQHMQTGVAAFGCVLLPCVRPWQQGAAHGPSRLCVWPLRVSGTWTRTCCGGSAAGRPQRLCLPWPWHAGLLGCFCAHALVGSAAVHMQGRHALGATAACCRA
jgi:hypothetical protein